MRRPIGWVAKNYPEGKREVRVSFHADTIKWQFRLKGAEEWNSTAIPAEDDWLELEEKILQLMQRGHLFQRELELVRRRGKSKGKGNGPEGIEKYGILCDGRPGNGRRSEG